MLIEADGGYLLVGIGCNVESRPEIIHNGKEGGRPATCLREHQETSFSVSEGSHYVHVDAVGLADASTLSAKDKSRAGAEIVELGAALESINISEQMPPEASRELAAELAQSIFGWVEQGEDSVQAVLADFERHMDFSPQVGGARRSKIGMLAFSERVWLWLWLFLL